MIAASRVPAVGDRADVDGSARASHGPLGALGTGAELRSAQDGAILSWDFPSAVWAASLHRCEARTATVPLPAPLRARVWRGLPLHPRSPAAAAGNRAPAAEAGAEELVQSLVTEHGPSLLGFVMRMTGDVHQAEDIVQETFLRAWRHPEALTGDSASPRGWLFTVARRLTADHWRREMRRRSADARAASDGVVGTDQFQQLLDAGVMAAALERLSPDHQEVLRQTIWMQRSVAEAAEALGVPQGTVKSRTYYALRSLRLALEEMGFNA